MFVPSAADQTMAEDPVSLCGVLEMLTFHNDFQDFIQNVNFALTERVRRALVSNRQQHIWLCMRAYC